MPVKNQRFTGLLVQPAI